MSVCLSSGPEGDYTEILFADTTVVLPWLKANKWGPPDLVTRVASLLLSLWEASTGSSLHLAEGLFGILTLRP